jgi:hypothetical protein
MTVLYTNTDDVNGDTRVEAWTNTGTDLHLMIENTETGQYQSIYLRQGTTLAKEILKAAWA